jgi:hypothetical protein
MAVLEEFQRRRKLLQNLRPTTATVCLGKMWNFLKKTDVFMRLNGMQRGVSFIDKDLRI